MKNKNRFLTALLGMLLATAGAYGQTKTTVADALFGPDGTAATGTLTVRAHRAFTASDGSNVVQGQATTASIAPDGSFSIALVPNIGGAPAGNYYDAEYITQTARVVETWVVPISGTAVKLSAVRVNWPASRQVYAFGTISLNLDGPTVGDSGNFSWEPPTNITITRVGCYLTGGGSSLDLNLEVRTEANPAASGTSVLNTALTCGSTFASSIDFANSNVSVRSPVALIFPSVSGTPQVLHVFIEYRIKLT